MLLDKTIFGLLKSCILGVFLGINLLPTDAETCTFECIYCEIPAKNLEKISMAELNAIAKRARSLGFDVSVSK